MTHFPAGDAIVLEPVEDKHPATAIAEALYGPGRWVRYNPVEDTSLLEDNDAIARALEEPKVRKFVEDVAAGLHAEQQRRVRPTKAAAQLDPADPDYREKLAELAREVKRNLVEEEEAAAVERAEILERVGDGTIHLPDEVVNESLLDMTPPGLKWKGRP